MFKRCFVIILTLSLLAINLPVKASNDFYFTNLQVMVNSRSATVAWGVNQAATGIVYFGLTNSYGNWLQDTRSDSYHETVLSGLLPNSTYHFKIEGHSSSGAIVTTDDYQFTTKQGNDGIAPQIANVRVTFATANTLTISWETDDLGDTRVFYDVQDGNLNSSRSDGRQTLVHDITLTGLRAATRYFFQVSSKDSTGSERRSGSYIATTGFGSDQTAVDLQVTSLNPFNQGATNDPNSATIRIATNRPISGRVRYGLRSKNYDKSVDLTAPRTTNSSVYLPGLQPDTVYYYILDLTDILGKHLLSQEYTFRTLPVNILRNPGIVIQPAPQPASPSSAYAYNQPRLTLSAEAKKSTELKKALIQKLGSRKVATVNSRNWQTLLKAYIYGGYPVQAIAQAIKWGGYTVHPAIAWSAWQNTATYQNYINR